MGAPAARRPRRASRSDLFGPDSALFSHFHLLAQLVANALQPLAHRGVVHARRCCQTRRAPAAVIPPIAQPPLFGVSVSSAVDRRCRCASVQLVSASSRTGTSGTSSKRRRQCRRARRMFSADGDHDAPEPADERGRFLQVAEPAERPEIRLLHRILCGSPVLQHVDRDGIRHRLRGVDQPAVNLDVPGLGSDEDQPDHSSYWSEGKTPRLWKCDTPPPRPIAVIRRASPPIRRKAPLPWRLPIALPIMTTPGANACTRSTRTPSRCSPASSFTRRCPPGCRDSHLAAPRSLDERAVSAGVLRHSHLSNDRVLRGSPASSAACC